MLLGLLLFASSALGTDIIVKNKIIVPGDFDLSLAPCISDEISIRASSRAVERNQVLIGIRFKVRDSFSTSLNLFLQNQRKYDWKLDYGPLAKIDLIF